MIKEKLYANSELLRGQVAHWQQDGDKVVFTNGCFDLLHPGHVTYLEQARALGQKLVIGVNTDKSVSDLKGPHRPIQHEDARCRVLAALESVNAVVLFAEDTPLALIKQLRPNVLVKGGDYTIDTIVGAQEVLGWGGDVKVIPFLEGYSTTAIEERIRSAQES